MKKAMFLFLIFFNLNVLSNDNIKICEQDPVPDGYIVIQEGLPSFQKCGCWLKNSKAKTWVEYQAKLIRKPRSKFEYCCANSNWPSNYIVIERKISGIPGCRSLGFKIQRID